MTALYTFANFELDAARFELRRGGVPVAVQPKVLKMLLHLVAQRERAVSNEELFSVLWPGERVGLASIKRAIIGARRVLGEGGDSQLSIRTVRGLGYQFVCPVHSGSALGRDDVLHEINRHVSRALLESNTVERLVQSLCAELTGRVLRELEQSARVASA